MAKGKKTQQNGDVKLNVVVTSDYIAWLDGYRLKRAEEQRQVKPQSRRATAGHLLLVAREIIEEGTLAVSERAANG